MATRKDLLKAQSFISRRMVAAFVDRDPDDPTPPLRRVGTASFVSILLGVVLLAGTALLGMLRPGGGTGWQEEGVIISDTSAGLLFIYSKGSLIPMADVASARLQAGGKDATAAPRVVKVSTEALKGTPQLPRLGIPGAPRQLPDAGDMLEAPLRLCSSTPNSGDDRFLSLEFSAEAPADDPISLVVRLPSYQEFLISNGKAHRLWAKQGEESLLIEDVPVVQPGKLWMSAMPMGDPLTPMTILDAGAFPKNKNLNMRIGALAEVEGAEGGAPRYYVQLAGGLSQISYLDMRMIQEDTGNTNLRKTSESELAEARNKEIPYSGNRDIDLGKPHGPSGYGSLENASVCATFVGEGGNKVALSVDVPTPAMLPGHLRPNGNRLDLVVMDQLIGALLQNGSTLEDAPTFLVLDNKSYPIPDVASRRALGYGDVEPVMVPGQLISLIEAGLDPDMNLSMGKITPIQ